MIVQRRSLFCLSNAALGLGSERSDNMRQLIDPVFDRIASEHEVRAAADEGVKAPTASGQRRR